MQVNIVSIDGYSADQSTRARSILGRTGTIISSDDFRNAVLNFCCPVYGHTFFFRPWQKAYSNEEVYEIIMAAVEIPGNVNNGVMDLYLIMDPGSNGNVVGYGNPGEKEIHTYSNIYPELLDNEYAAHITHEWTHKLGFVHDVNEMPMRRYSVPYGIQGIITELY